MKPEILHDEITGKADDAISTLTTAIEILGTFKYMYRSKRFAKNGREILEECLASITDRWKKICGAEEDG